MQPQTNPQDIQPIEWNIYSRELQRALATRGRALASLYHIPGIHPEIVRRLVESLRRPGITSVLSRENNQLVCDTFNFSDDERARLRAAIFATAIYATLMSRVPNPLAHTIADQAFIILAQHIKDLPAFERSAAPEPPQAGAAGSQGILDATIAIIDRAQIALHLSATTDQSSERTSRAWQAYQDFKLAVEQLHGYSPEIQMSDTWHAWHAEAEYGRRAAEEMLVL